MREKKKINKKRSEFILLCICYCLSHLIGLLSVTWLSLLHIFKIYFLFLTDEGPTLETLDCTIRIGSTPTYKQIRKWTKSHIINVLLTSFARSVRANLHIRIFLRILYLINNLHFLRFIISPHKPSKIWQVCQHISPLVAHPSIRPFVRPLILIPFVLCLFIFGLFVVKVQADHCFCIT